MDVPREKNEEYRDSLRAKGIEVTEIVNHSDQPGTEQYLPDEPTANTFVRSIYFQDPDGITLEFACWGQPLTPEDVIHTAKTAADLNPEKRAETVRRAQAAVETIGANQPSTSPGLPSAGPECRVTAGIDERDPALRASVPATMNEAHDLRRGSIGQRPC